MLPDNNKEPNVSNIQLYVQNFINLIDDNPTYSCPRDGGATAEMLNDLFIDGFKPAGFRSLVKDLGTKDINTTMGSLNQLYKDMAVYYRIAKRLSPSGIQNNGREPIVKKPAEPGQPTPPKSKENWCTKTQCNSKTHKPAECPFVHPHLWDPKKNPKKSFIASIPEETSPTDPPFQEAPAADVMTMDEVTAMFQKMMSTKIVESKVNSHPRMSTLPIIPAKPNYFDSGNNYSVISDKSHIDNNTSISLTFSEDGLETAGGAILPIEGAGIMHDLPAIYVPESIASLTSVSQFNRERDAISIFFQTGVLGIALNKKIRKHLFKIKEIAEQNNLILLEGHLNSDNLYELKPKLQPYSPSIYQGHYGGAGHSVAMAAYYQSAEFKTISEHIRFFHEAWGHPSREQMCWIIRNGVFKNIPKNITEKAVRKHFPHCEACPAANMAQQPMPGSIVPPREANIGEEFQLDIKVIADNSKARKHKRAIGKYTSTLTAIDKNSGYLIGFLLKNHVHLETTLEKLRLEIFSKHRILKIVRLDNQFITEPIREWSQLHHIDLLPCIPYEHHSIGEIERFHRTLQDGMFKQLYNKPHLNITYWGHAYKDILMHANFNGSIHDDPPISPFEQWHSEKPDLEKYPMLPFGSIVMAHIPLKLQSVGSPRSELTYCVGTSLDHKKGLRLYNPTTKKEIIRGTFKTLGPIRPPIERATYEVTEADDILEIEKDNNLQGDEFADVDDYKYLINTDHIDPEDMVLYRTVDVVVEEFDTDIGPTIVAYRRRVQPSGRLYAMTEDDEYPYQIGDIVEYTVQHSQYILNNLPSKSTNPHKRTSEFDKHTAILNTAVSKKYIKCIEQKIAHIARSQLPKVYVFPDNRLPRNNTDILNMSDNNPDKQGFINATQAELAAVLGMGTWNPQEIVPDKIEKKLIGSSKFVYTKKYHPDGSFDKYKARIVFRGDKWYDLYQNKTYAGTVMSESVRLLLAIAAAEDLELQSADVNSAFLYGEIPDTQYIYICVDLLV